MSEFYSYEEGKSTDYVQVFTDGLKNPMTSNFLDVQTELYDILMSLERAEQTKANNQKSQIKDFTFN